MLLIFFYSLPFLTWNLVNSQAKAFRPNDSDDDDSDDDYSDDEELQSPIDEVDPFIFFVDSIKGKWNL